MDLEHVATVRDLEEYLREHPSPVVADILQRAIKFFSQECRKDDGRKDWKAIKARERLGLKFQLRPDSMVSKEVAEALRMWKAFPGRDLGTSFLDAMTSQAVGKISDPRKEASRILDFFSKR